MIIDDPAAYHSTSVCLMLSPTSRSQTAYLSLDPSILLIKS